MTSVGDGRSRPAADAPLAERMQRAVARAHHQLTANALLTRFARAAPGFGCESSPQTQ